MLLANNKIKPKKRWFGQLHSTAQFSKTQFNSIYSPASGKIIIDSILMGLTKLFTLFAKPCLTAFLLPSAASISLMLKIIEVSESSVRNLASIQKHYHNLTVLIASFK